MVPQWQGKFCSPSSCLPVPDLLPLFPAVSDLFCDARYLHTEMTNPDPTTGVHAIQCEMFEELPEKMKEFLKYRGDKPVFPMVRLPVSSLKGLT
jgi:hypothetical protein